MNIIPNEQLPFYYFKKLILGIVDLFFKEFGDGSESIQFWVEW